MYAAPLGAPRRHSGNLPSTGLGPQGVLVVRPPGFAPRAAPGRDCVSRPEVPHPAPPKRRLAWTPLSGQDSRDLARLSEQSKNILDEKYDECPYSGPTAYSTRSANSGCRPI